MVAKNLGFGNTSIVHKWCGWQQHARRGICLCFFLSVDFLLLTSFMVILPPPPPPM